LRRLAAIAALVLLCGSLAGAAEDEDRARKEQGGPTYESPVLSLLFLPVNLLIKMASVFGPGSAPSGQQDRPTSSTPTK